MSFKKRILFSVFTGLLLTPAWYEWGHGLILLIALIPLLFVEDYLDQNKTEFGSGSFFLYSALAFLVWNSATTWWIYNATAIGVILAVLINTMMWSLVMWLFHVIKRRMGMQIGYFSLILFWITWEYFYHNTEISWPWLSLGNGFSYNIRIIQWYEFTGIFGGSLWVLVLNILIFNLIRGYLSDLPLRRITAQVVIIVVLIMGPIVFSLQLFYNYEEVQDPVSVVVIQPNIDPYEKFISIPSTLQTRIQINEAAKVADSGVDYFISPETSINNNIWLNRINEVPDIKMIRDFLQIYPGAAYIPGIQCFKAYFPGDKLTDNVRDLPGTDLKYESFNAAIQIDSTDNVPVYFKSKLVVGVEKMPYARYLKFLENFTLKLGGTFRGWGTQDERGVFFSAKDSTGVSPVICYESVYGEFVTGYVKNGANLLFVITNDGWWGDTPGYHQHNSFSSLRAIETRRSVARSANTGISCLINQRGEVIQKMGWWQQGALKGTLNANDEFTFYVKNGDYIGRAASFFSGLIILLFFVRLIIKK
ncbi:MAG TPA: apolipoprotein N-acyltransferase [Bacteroidales bacterium]|jgi:apolipoprotein N-acyltransferase|nr:apolipoprotein N-acyltransferase [Bacteroidales bacterium]